MQLAQFRRRVEPELGGQLAGVAPAIDVPAKVYVVVPSSTSVTADAGSVTASVGGFAKRKSWTPR